MKTINKAVRNKMIKRIMKIYELEDFVWNRNFAIDIWLKSRQQFIKEINKEISKATNENEELSAIARVLNKEV